jgi:hypothetical protein
MDRGRRQVAVLRFGGPRFVDHGLDVDVLPELVAYKRLLQETAKEVWRRRNPKRQRLPWHFETVIALKFFELQPGSTGVPLYRAELSVDNEEPLLPLEDEVGEAAVLLDDVMTAAVERQPIPKFFPRGIIPLFDQFGQTLRPDEFILIAPAIRPRAVRYDRNVRATLLGWAVERYTDVIDLVGEVRSTDLDGQRFSLRLSDDRKIPGRFRPDQEALILEALNDHASRRLRIVGSGEFSHENGALQQIASVDRIEVLPATGPTAAEVPIWERISRLGAAVPDEVWNAVPNDLSQNLHKYLYGRKDVS